MFIFMINVHNSFGCVWCNGAGSGYDGGGDEGNGSAGTAGINNPIEYYITLGAGYYLNATSDFQKFLKMVEMQDIERPTYFKIPEGTL